MPAVASLTELRGDTDWGVRVQNAFSQAVFEQVQTLYDWFSCFSDHDRNSQSASYQTGLPCSEPPVRSAEPECWAREVPEVIE